MTPHELSLVTNKRRSVIVGLRTSDATHLLAAYQVVNRASTSTNLMSTRHGTTVAYLSHTPVSSGWQIGNPQRTLNCWPALRDLHCEPKKTPKCFDIQPTKPNRL